MERVDVMMGIQSAQEGDRVSRKKRKSGRSVFVQHFIQVTLSLRALDSYIKCCLTIILYHDFY